MSQEPDHEGTVTVSAGGVSLEKTFAADEFPVPAIKFVIRSERDDVVDVRLSDDIPESFSMERIGFHPDYESANWTAYEDQFVEYERSLDPDEEVLTVYGIRVDDEEDVSAFLTEPMLETIVPGDEGDTVESVVGDDRSEVVRNVLADEATALPGLEADDPVAAGLDTSESSDPAADDADAPEPLALEDPLADDPLSEVPEIAEEPPETTGESTETTDEPAETTDEPVETTDTDDEPEPLALEDPLSTSDEADESVESSESVDESTPVPRSLSSDLTAAVVARQSDATPLGTQFDEVSDETPAPDAEVEATPVAAVAADAAPSPQTGVAAALADEIRSGDVDDEDLELLRDELDLGLPRSVDVRIRRLQSQMDDLKAYSDALETFLDENGTADELVTDLRGELESLSATADKLETDVAALREDRTDLASTVDDVSGRLDGVDERVASVDAGVESLDDEMGEVRSDLADLDSQLVSVEELSADERAELEAELELIRQELEALDSFRDRLSSVFGGEQ
ncbi:hypothetical protein [Haloprofundus salinisoli]|uniref:hypothetical protein n=1 Tax=Haloprofundus salinisoli TaxID=2876193 RepID=UPI001CCD8845|nr:hypothetical protein [Haloprofundus salinisoli]